MAPGEGAEVRSGVSDFVVVANRLPIDMERLPDGTTTWKRSPGGLVTAMEPLRRRPSKRPVARSWRDPDRNQPRIDSTLRFVGLDDAVTWGGRPPGLGARRLRLRAGTSKRSLKSERPSGDVQRRGPAPR